MSTKEFNARIRLKRDTSANWTQHDPVLLNGEVVIVDTADGKVRTKTGNGAKKFSSLPFDDEEMKNYVDSICNSIGQYINNSLNSFNAYMNSTLSTFDNKKGDRSVCIEATLSADAWSDKIQAVQVTGLGAAQNGIVSLRHGCTESEYNAACEAKLMVHSQSSEQLAIMANGKVPEVDIPVEIVLLG